MFYVFLLLIVACLLAAGSNRYRKLPSGDYPYYTFDHQNVNSQMFCWLLLFVLVIFSGTRTWGNDTPGYIVSYLFKIKEEISWEEILAMKLGENPGFILFETSLKSIFGNKFIWLLTTFSLVVNGSILLFFYKYSRNFCFSIFLYIASCHYAFTLGAQKQVLAISFGIWLLPLALKKKWIGFVALLFLAMSFHPYVMMLGVIPLLTDSVWGKKSLLILLGTLVFILGMKSILPVVSEVTSSFGDNYIGLADFQGQGVNIFRVLVLAVTPILSLIGKKDINRGNDKILIACCNMSLLAFACMLISVFADPNLFGRLAAYFEVFTYTALSCILQYYTPMKFRRIMVCFCIAGYTIFYYIFYLKYGGEWFVDIYRHLNLIEYF